MILGVDGLFLVLESFNGLFRNFASSLASLGKRKEEEEEEKEDAAERDFAPVIVVVPRG